MNGINIHLLNTDFNGAISMESSSSHFKAIRVKKDSLSLFSVDLSNPGVYLLLIENDTVYVGKTGLDDLAKRITNTHSGTIDTDWHTVLAFPCTSPSISDNELLFLENAMCEYVIKYYPKCANSSPAPKNCNAAFRNVHYKLSSASIQECKHYLDDILHYIKLFPSSIFPPASPVSTPSLVSTTSSPVTPLSSPTAQTDTFYYDNPKRDAHGKAVIEIHCGHNGKRKTVLLKGSQISNQVSTAFTSHTSVIALRDQYEKAGKIVNRVLQEDLEFYSQSGAGQFLNGTSFDGNGCWKTVKGDVPLKKLL